ncbi:MAG TPA: hypothetical protein VGY58_16630 [Gemmataceae bacterium]|jgi:hypothetical protein|nr:hypothetical protein [Gemmataceae bacterium]
MADIKLGRYEAEEGQLPPLCLCCGAPATHYQAQTLAWQPAWSYFVFGLTVWPLLFLGLLLRKRMRVRLPLCDAHRRSLQVQRRIAQVLMVVLLGVLVGGAVLLNREDEAGNYAVNPLLLLWLDGIPIMMALLLLRAGAVRPQEITDDSITLGDVAEDFVNQWHAERTGRPTVSGARRGATASPSPATSYQSPAGSRPEKAGR